MITCAQASLENVHTEPPNKKYLSVGNLPLSQEGLNKTSLDSIFGESIASVAESRILAFLPALLFSQALTSIPSGSFAYQRHRLELTGPGCVFIVNTRKFN